MTKRRTKKDKIIARLRHQTLKTSSQARSYPQTLLYTPVKRQSPTPEVTPSSPLQPKKSPQYSAISPHSAAIKQALLKTLILSLGLGVFELVLYCAWR